MEEREALKRQIELLQNLINKHKSVHGDTPFPRDEPRHPEAPTSARGRGHSTSVVHPHSSRGRLYAPQSHGSWRKMYSLSNKDHQSSVRHPSASTSSSVHQSHSVSQSSSLPSLSRGEESQRVNTATISSGSPQQKREGHRSSITGSAAKQKQNKDTLRKTAVSQDEGGKEDSSSTGTNVPTSHRQAQEFLQRTESKPAVQPEKNVGGSQEVPSSVKAKTTSSLQSSPQPQIKPSLTSKTSSDAKRTLSTTTPAIPTTGSTAPPLPALLKVPKQPSVNTTSHTSQGQASFLKKSKFTWVKSQNIRGVEPKQTSLITSSPGKAVTAAPTSVSKAGAASGSSPSFSSSKRTPAKKLPRKLSTVIVAPKTSKYKWVSSSAGAQAKIPRKSPSPKALTHSQRALEKGEATKKLRAASTPSAKIKKGIAGSSSNSSLSSRYRWKAGGQSTSVAVTGGGAVSRRRSAFHWTSEKNNKGVKGGFVLSPSVAQRTSLSPSSSPGGFKLRSRMKIIRKSASSGGVSEKGASPSAVKFSPRGRLHTLTRSPIGVRRTPSRELVSFGRHKLRRLSPTLSRTSPTFSSSSHRGPASQRVFRTRYKMVTRPGSSTSHTPHYNPGLSWRAKRIQTARSFLQSRMRAPHYRHPSSTQHWRGSSMCWIRGSLYRVSANKLSRTVASSMSINRTGRSFSSGQVSPMSPAFTRSSSSRHLASRAVQRSLAIIRHARQKKQQKQYCMYYNRFGKCNRGNSCPYIHDPDKVAVCTRFLRGTCKQADGTCPFSHKVAKEKMPVCSYFLKGICNNSDCPYSHVYVSRKAEVCEDFVKGYCPEGEKCKKKHTLVCPDFSKTGSCPRGARCKLQHRQRVKRSASSTSTATAKRARTKEPSKRPRLSVVMPQGSQAAPGTPTKGPLELPSFISLSSSPEEADAPDTLPAETLQVKEKKLQIKPRL
ncbi:zinc finger CCCH domain-containing protein 3 isoform X2 [Plectropomus leopardus]|uniref:zinc finger CCCH domain-containing protein 3 isoform X2 n=1 Tax=Plectropomus leopardus TaxID=160734 RepID=UPI001C4C81C4|nr:zinc finger CCCH domain-containing protein 3 isoform X2 [Plectropomus leopardus]